jgi:hypothetical protein
VKNALQQEVDLIGEELKQLRGEVKAGNPKAAVDLGRKLKGPAVTLTGVQADAVRTLSPSSKPHEIRGSYEIPVGKTLMVEAGVMIQCAPDSEITVKGSLVMEGTKEKPIVLGGMKSGPGFWKGIAARESEKVCLARVELYDANIAMFVSKCQPVLTGCVLAGNTIGVKVDSRGKPPVMEDCAISYNAGDGISMGGISSMTIKSCTISYNGGWGINGVYYPSPSISGSIVTRNKSGGIYLAQYESKAEAHDSAIGGNANLDVKFECKNDVDFTRNYWGPEATKMLKSAGATANLPSIFDAHDKADFGRVQIGDFLDKMPDKCGASITSVRGRPTK